MKDSVDFKIHDVTTLLTKNTIHILSNISRSKDKQPMKFGQLIEYNKGNILKKNHAENEARRLALELFLFFKKALYEQEY